MKTICAFAVLVAMVVAEPPPSNSYLPPSPNSNNGYPSGGPQVVAARSFNPQGGFGQRGNGLARNGNQGFGGNGFGPQARFGAAAQQGYQQAGAFGRNGLDDFGSEPAKYNFGYAVNDGYEGTDFGHHEHREDEKATGEYHVVLPDGRKQTVSYEADEQGFKPRISYEDTQNGYSDNGPQNGGYSKSRPRGF